MSSEYFMPLLRGPTDIETFSLPADVWSTLERLYGTPFNEQIRAEIDYICAVRRALFLEPLITVDAEKFEADLSKFLEVSTDLLGNFRSYGANNNGGYEGRALLEDPLDQLGFDLPRLLDLASTVYDKCQSVYIFRKQHTRDAWVSWLTQIFSFHSLATGASQGSDKSPDDVPTSPFVHAVALLNNLLEYRGPLSEEEKVWFGPSWRLSKEINRARSGEPKTLSFLESLDYWERKCRYQERFRRFRFDGLDGQLKHALSFSLGT